MRNYLTAYLKHTVARPQPPGVILGNVHPHQLTKLTKPTSARQESSSVSFVSSLPHTYPEIQGGKRGVQAGLTKLTKPSGRVARRVPKQPERKVWRRAPLWQACLDATRQPSGVVDVEACDLLFAALALHEGHTPEETREMLHRCTPRASTHLEYCSNVVSRASVNPASHVTAELAARSASAHPFAWELGLK